MLNYHLVVDVVVDVSVDVVDVNVESESEGVTWKEWLSNLFSIS